MCEVPMMLLVETFSGLCREAEQYGVTIGFEPDDIALPILQLLSQPVVKCKMG